MVGLLGPTKKGMGLFGHCLGAVKPHRSKDGNHHRQQQSTSNDAKTIKKSKDPRNLDQGKSPETTGRKLKEIEALSPFCQLAFKQSHPMHGYETLSGDIVKLASGLPLALNLYGKLLCGKNKNYWKEMLKQLKEYPKKEVLGRLEVVYARLDKYQRYVK
ncbi:hypothetical protein QVD17_39310 [Tagetes erecta]|uniref:Uncharacterized protein n=1 Tax=Tagetes erecta TaxID=13708 RepID=A0AAD8NGZ3_TARER|nr:hypothetical protein QVD17_39310 [Tagetes erecta]